MAVVVGELVLHMSTHVMLKLLSAIFYQIFIFSPNDSLSKTMKNVFYFIKKTLFVLEIFNFFEIFPFLSKLSSFKRTNGSGIIYDVMHWPAKICRCSFWNNSKTALCNIIRLGQIICN